MDSKLDEQYLIVKGRDITWYRPTNLKTLLALKEQYPNAKIIIGNTEIGSYISLSNTYYDIKI